MPQGAPLLLGNQFVGSLAHRQATPAGTTCRFQHEQKNGVQLLARKISIPFSKVWDVLLKDTQNQARAISKMSRQSPVQDEMDPSTVAEWYGWRLCPKSDTYFPPKIGRKKHHWITIKWKWKYNFEIHWWITPVYITIRSIIYSN